MMAMAAMPCLCGALQVTSKLGVGTCDAPRRSLDEATLGAAP
jgi:hypothetical protein